MLTIFATTCSMIPDVTFSKYMMSFALSSKFFELYLTPSSLQHYFHDIWFFNVFNFFVLIIKLKTLIFTVNLFYLFGTHTLLNK